MNARPALTAALLMTASLAMSQAAVSPAFNMIRAGASSGLTGFCLPSDSTCQNSVMTGLAAANPSETIAAYTLPEGSKWASPDCQHIPCKLAESAPGEPGFIGPPAPNSINGGAFSINNDNPNGDVRKKTGESKSAPVAALNAPDENSSVAAGNPARDHGAGFAADQDRLTKSFDSTSASGNGDEAAAATEDTSARKVDGATVADTSAITVTHDALRPHEKDLKDKIGTFENGRMNDFAAPNADLEAAGTLPADETGGRIRAAANQ